MKRAAALACVLACAAASAQTVGDLKGGPPVQSGPVAPVEAQKVREAYRRFLALKAGDPAMRAEALRRLADLELEAADALRAEGAQPGAGTAEIRAAIALYEELLRQEPDSPKADSVMYQVGRAWEALGETERALGYLDRLVVQFPKSRHFDEAQFRRGEILFSARRYADAERAYEAVIRMGPDSSFHEQSLYKHGWSLFKQSENEASVDSFVKLLDRKMTDPNDRARVLDPAGMPRADRELVEDTFRVLSIGFSYSDGAASIDRYLARNGARAYDYLLYSQLGDLYVGKQRYTDAADTYRAFVARAPDHERAPLLQMQAIDAYKAGGFAQLVLEGKKEFVERFRLASPFWSQRKPADHPQVAAVLKTNLTDLAQYYHSAAQKSKKTADYHEASRWYREFLQSFPDDPEADATNFLLAETLFESQQYREAALEYERTAYAYAQHEKSAIAGYAALVSYEREAKSLSGEAKSAWYRQGLESQLRFATTFPAHPESAPLLTRTAREFYDLKDLPRAIEVVGFVLARRPPVDTAMQRTAWLVTGNAQFDSGQYADAEGAYLQVQSLQTPGDADAAAVNERLAASIYKQGEQKQGAGEATAAVEDFLRVGRLAPGSTIRETAEFDAAALLVGLKDWPRAIDVLESYRRSYPASPRQADVTRNLAVAYVEAGRPGQAAGEFERIAIAPDEKPDLQRQALWQAALLYEQGQMAPQALVVYERYVERFPVPVNPAMEARLKLADAAQRSGDPAGRQKWLENIVVADRAAGEGRTDRSRYLAARASLELATPARDVFRSIALVAPLNQALASKKSAMERAIAGYEAASKYAVAEVTTAATFEMADLYRRLAVDLMQSERPKDLGPEELEQYDVLLEEQAFPFEEKAAQIHEQNTARAAEGLYDEWVRRSYAELAALLPARFGKSEEREPFIAELKPLPLPLPATPPPPPKKGEPPPPPPAPTVPAELQASFAGVVSQLEAGDFAGARPALERLLAAPEPYPEPAINLGMLHAREARWAEAESALQEGLKRDPSSVIALNELAIVWRENGRFQDAEANYRRALEADPAHVRTHLNLGVLLDLYLRRPAEALVHFETYQSQAGAENRVVSGWIAELRRRVEAAGQTAQVTP